MGGLLRNQIVQTLAALAACIAIIGEAVSTYSNAQKARIEIEAARNAADLKAAEARKMQAEADKARADAEAARAMAINAEVRQRAEAELASQKAAVEIEAARNAAKLKAAEADRAQIQARGAEQALREIEAVTRDPGGYARQATRDGLKQIDNSGPRPKYP